MRPGAQWYSEVAALIGTIEGATVGTVKLSRQLVGKVGKYIIRSANIRVFILIERHLSVIEEDKL